MYNVVMNKIEKLKEIIDDSQRIVFFTGAGISVPSGIPDFRSANGLYNTNLSAEEILSHTYFMHHPKEFYDFYFKNMVYLDAKPNKAHEWIKTLANEKDVAVVTQNIDGLHGLNKVYELHGSIHRNTCLKCHQKYNLKEIMDSYQTHNKEIPLCTCGGVIKPDVVLYEEGLDDHTVYNAVNAIANADTLIIIGTSLNVYPAASFITYFSGKHIVVINKDDNNARAELVINDDIVHVVNEYSKL